MTGNNQSSQLETILNSIADGIFTVDLDWRVTSFNRAAEKITGMPRSEAIGKKCFDVFHANICQGQCALRETLESGREIIARHINIIDRMGNIVPVSISTAVLRNDQGEIIGGVETFRDLSPIEELRKELLNSYAYEDMVSKNHEMIRIFNLLPLIAKSESNVLIQGPSGSGKELVARALHNLSLRRAQPYVAINCGALPDTLLESELFGYTKGAFTGADKNKPGRFALAEGGTIFLDEIGDISPAFQIKLLRAIQEHEYTPLGSNKNLKMNVRVIAATNKDLLQRVREKTFREDLYYRLNVVKIELPSLAERREDIPLLINHFIRSFNLRRGKNIAGISPAALRSLMEYNFPGNIRELENIIEYAFVICQGHTIGIEHLPKEVLQPKPVPAATSDNPPVSIRPVDERELIRQTLVEFGGHKGKTAAALRMDRSTLWRKMKKYGLD